MNLANKISLSRILMVPFFVAGLFLYTPDRLWMRVIVVGIFCCAMVADFADGFIARMRKQETQLGKALDPLADKLLLFNAYIWIYHLQCQGSLPLEQRLPFLVVFLVISRDVIILLGLLLLFLFKIEINFSPNVWGKITTFFQMMTVMGVLLDWFFAPILWSGVVMFTLVSGVLYVKRGVKVINAVDSKNTINIAR